MINIIFFKANPIPVQYIFPITIFYYPLRTITLNYYIIGN